LKIHLLSLVATSLLINYLIGFFSTIKCPNKFYNDQKSESVDRIRLIDSIYRFAYLSIYSSVDSSLDTERRDDGDSFIVDHFFAGLSSTNIGSSVSSLRETNKKIDSYTFAYLELKLRHETFVRPKK
jgi:hypothetical protein